MNVFRECSNQICRFRYPELDIEHTVAYCPKCGYKADIVFKLPEKQSVEGKDKQNKGFGNSIIAVLDNIRSIYNVGSIFRTSDGLGVDELVLGGITSTPDNPRFSKTSLGAENHVNWQYQPNALLACKDLQNDGYFIVSLEKNDQGTNLYAVSKDIFEKPVALVIGNEKTGVDPGIIQLSDKIISIPMRGYKNSYNVAISYRIAISYFYSLSAR